MACCFIPPLEISLYKCLSCFHVLKNKNPLEKSIVLFLFSAFNQFFFDANKRVARLMMNGILMSNGFDAIMIPAKDKNEFNLEMLKFYNTNNADSIMRFMLKCYNLNSANL